MPNCSVDLLREMYDVDAIGRILRRGGMKYFLLVLIAMVVNSAYAADPYGGVGLVLNINGSNLEVIGVVANSPSDRAGLRVGDQLVKIDGQAVDMTSVIKNAVKIRGLAGTDVMIDVSRKGELAKTYTLQRELIKANAPRMPQQPGSVLGFEVRKNASDYQITDFEPITDVAGNQHTICGGTSLVSRDGLTQRLLQEFSQVEDPENKVVSYIEKLNREKAGVKKLCSGPAMSAPAERRFDVVRTYGDFPLVFDWVRISRPFSHEYKFTFYRALIDLDGHRFFAFDSSADRSREGLRAKMADLEEKIRSPLTNYNEDAVKRWKSDLEPVKAYLDRIYALEYDQAKAVYLGSKITFSSNAERDSDSVVDCVVMGKAGKCPRDPNLPLTSAHGMLAGTVINQGKRMVVRLEVTADFMNKSGRKIAERVYALPFEESIGDMARAVPSDIFSFGPGVSKDFHIKISDVPSEWSGRVVARVSDITFSEDYVEVLREIRTTHETWLAQWLKEGNADQASAQKRIVDQIDSKIAEVESLK